MYCIYSEIFSIKATKMNDDCIPSFRRGTQGFHKYPPSHFILGINFISAQVFLAPLVSSSTVLRHVFLCLPLPSLPWGFHFRACLPMSSAGFRNVWPSHTHLPFLICKSILGCFVRFHSSLFVIWFGQKILNICINLQAPRFLYIGQAFRYSPENAFYIFNQQIYFIIRYLLDRASLI